MYSILELDLLFLAWFLCQIPSFSNYRFSFSFHNHFLPFSSSSSSYGHHSSLIGSNFVPRLPNLKFYRNLNSLWAELSVFFKECLPVFDLRSFISLGTDLDLEAITFHSGTTMFFHVTVTSSSSFNSCTPTCWLFSSRKLMFKAVCTLFEVDTIVEPEKIRLRVAQIYDFFIAFGRKTLRRGLLLSRSMPFSSP